MLPYMLDENYPADFDALLLFGLTLGLSFQIKDDLLGYTSSSDILGKTKNKDELRNQPNYVNLLGIDETVKLLKENKRIKNISVKVPNFKTPTKTRFINETEHLLRLDNENINFKLINKYTVLIIEKLKKEIIKNDLIILSDYDKGLLDKDLIKKIIKISIQNNKIK